MWKTLFSKHFHKFASRRTAKGLIEPFTSNSDKPSKRLQRILFFSKKFFDCPRTLKDRLGLLRINAQSLMIPSSFSTASNVSPPFSSPDFRSFASSFISRSVVCVFSKPCISRIPYLPRPFFAVIPHTFRFFFAHGIKVSCDNEKGEATRRFVSGLQSRS